MRRFEIKEAEEAELSNAREFTREPSGAPPTDTLQVISSEFWEKHFAVLEVTIGVLGGFDEVEEGERVVVPLSM